MSVGDFRNYMSVLARDQALDHVTFHGGEPFLFYKTLARCVEIAHGMGQKEVKVITNGYWGGNQTGAQRKLKELKEAGLSSISFSVDVFHQEFVPFRSVRAAINSARKVGFDEIVVTSEFLGSTDARNPFNLKTEENLERLRLPEDFKIVRSSLSLRGRAVDELSDFLRSKVDTPQGKCVLPSWAGNTLRNPETIEIDFAGNVTVCPGLCIGNAKTDSLSRIIREYDYSRHQIIKILVEHGPYKLSELAGMVKEFKSKRYVDECHLCYDLRRNLAGYPELLAPSSSYSEQ